MANRNHKLLQALPTGFTALASLQTAGRGRGSNVWVSPIGCLLFSTCIRHPAGACARSPVVFVQYIAALAVVEAVKSYAPGYEEFPIHIKWPNDICTLGLPSSAMTMDTDKAMLQTYESLRTQRMVAHSMQRSVAFWSSAVTSTMTTF